MSAAEPDPGDRAADVRAYVVGFALALVLTALCFGAAVLNVFGPYGTMGFIAALGLVQVLVHLRFFLHLDLSRQKREDVQLVLFTVLIIALMACGTLWVLGDLMKRMA